MSDPIAERLTRFTPESGLDRDALLVEAGRRSARPRSLWLWLAAFLACTQALTLVTLWPRPSTPPIPTPVPALDGPVAPEGLPSPPDRELPDFTGIEGLVPDGAPLRAFGAPPADAY